MATSVYTSLLIKDFKRKSGNVLALRKELRDLVKVVLALEGEVSALVTLIQSRDPEFTPASAKATRTVPKVLGLPWNKLSILTIEAIKTAEVRPVHIKEVIDYVIVHGQIQVENRRAYSVVYFCVKDSLRRLKKRGKLVHAYENTKETEGLWDLASNE